MGGNLIGSHIIPLGTGIDYVANMIKASVREKTDFTPHEKGKCVVTRLLALTPGIVKKLPDFSGIAEKIRWRFIIICNLEIQFMNIILI